MPEPRKLPAHPWAEENEPIPAGYPPVEVSYILAIEREFIDDTRYIVRDLLEVRADMTPLDATMAAFTIVDRARREWRDALLASAAGTRATVQPVTRNALGDIADRVYGSVKPLDAVAPGRIAMDDLSLVMARVEAHASSADRPTWCAIQRVRATLEAAWSEGRIIAAHPGENEKAAFERGRQAGMRECAAHVADLEAELARRDAQPDEEGAAEAESAPGAERVGPGPDRPMTLASRDANRSQRCLDLVWRLRDGKLPMDAGFTFVGWPATRAWLHEAAGFALDGGTPPPSFYDRWADETGEARDPVAGLQDAGPGTDPDFREVGGTR